MNYGIPRSLLVALFSMILSGTLHAERRWTHYGVRPLGMGNAYVAVADDFNALFYNPAGLARLKTWDFEIFNPAFEISLNSWFLVKELSDDSGKKELEDVLDLLEEQSGTPHYIGLNLTPHFVMKHFGVGIGIHNFLSFKPHAGVDVDTQVKSQTLAPIGIAFNFLEDKLSVGASIKPVFEFGVDQTIDLDTISIATEWNEKKDELMAAGNGIGLDVGMLYTPMETMEPTIGVSITDFGGTVLKKHPSFGSKPAPRAPSVNTGLSFKPVKTEKTYVLVSVDTHSINQSSHFSKKLNLGTEWGFSKILKVQAGLLAGHITAGLQFDVGLLNIRIATYAVDEGAVAGIHPKLVDRRVVFQLKLLI